MQDARVGYQKFRDVPLGEPIAKVEECVEALRGRQPIRFGDTDVAINID